MTFGRISECNIRVGKMFNESCEKISSYLGPQHWEKFQWIPLSDLLVDKLRSGVYVPANMRGEGIPLIDTKEVFSYDVLDENCSHDKVPLTESEVERFALNNGDLLFARKDLTENAGRCVLYNGNDNCATFSGDVIRAKIDTNKGNSWFLYGFFNSKLGKSIIRTIMEKTASSGIRSSDLLKIPVPEIPLPRQNSIGEILKTYNEAIQLNSNRANLIDNLSKLYFESLFRLFEPKNMVATDKHLTGLIGEISSLYPKTMKDSEIGPIPNGWEVRTLGELTSKITTGLNPRKNFILGTGENYYVTTKNISQGRIFFDDSCDLVDSIALDKINKRSKLQIGETLLTGVGSIGETFMLYKNPHNWNINESIYSLRANKEIISEYLLYRILNSDRFKNYCEEHAVGSVQIGIRKFDIERYRVAIPPYSLSEKISKLFKINMDLFKNSILNLEYLEKQRNLIFSVLLDSDEVLLS